MAQQANVQAAQARAFDLGANRNTSEGLGDLSQSLLQLLPVINEIAQHSDLEVARKAEIAQLHGQLQTRSANGVNFAATATENAQKIQRFHLLTRVFAGAAQGGVDLPQNRREYTFNNIGESSTPTGPATLHWLTSAFDMCRTLNLNPNGVKAFFKRHVMGEMGKLVHNILEQPNSTIEMVVQMLESVYGGVREPATAMKECRNITRLRGEDAGKFMNRIYDLAQMACRNKDDPTAKAAALAMDVFMTAIGRTVASELETRQKTRRTAGLPDFTYNELALEALEIERSKGIDPMTLGSRMASQMPRAQQFPGFRPIMNIQAHELDAELGVDEVDDGVPVDGDIEAEGYCDEANVLQMFANPRPRPYPPRQGQFRQFGQPGRQPPKGFGVRPAQRFSALARNPPLPRWVPRLPNRPNQERKVFQVAQQGMPTEEFALVDEAVAGDYCHGSYDIGQNPSDTSLIEPADYPELDWEVADILMAQATDKAIGEGRLHPGDFGVTPSQCLRCGLENHRFSGPTAALCPLRGKPLQPRCPKCQRGGHLPSDCPTLRYVPKNA